MSDLMGRLVADVDGGQFVFPLETRDVESGGIGRYHPRSVPEHARAFPRRRTSPVLARFVACHDLLKAKAPVKPELPTSRIRQYQGRMLSDRW